MWGGYSWARRAQTTIPCKKCQKPLVVERSCQSVALVCEHCGARGTLNEYIDKMDDALEEFMEGVFCDRT